jgi:hypothetical protein
MAEIYSNENVPAELVAELRRLGHNCLTSLEAGNANLRIADDVVLAFANSQSRVVLTNNRLDFIRLHRSGLAHAGIVVFTLDPNIVALASRIHNVLTDTSAQGRFLARVDRGGFRFDP